MKRIEVLEKVKAAKVLALEHNTTDAFARDAAGRSVSAVDPKAVCWCSVGALEKELDIENHNMHHLCPVLGPSNRGVLIEANDKAKDSLESEWDRIIIQVQEWALQDPQEEKGLPNWCESYSGYWSEPGVEDSSEGYGSLKYD